MAYQSARPLPTILVIDDDTSVANALHARLGTHFRVMGLAQPERAVEVARREKPDLVMCDINMPGATGDEVALALSMDAQTQHLPLVYLSANIPAGTAVELGEQFGGHLGVSKRFSAAQMLEVIRSAML